MKTTLNELMLASRDLDNALSDSQGELTPEIEAMLDLTQNLKADKVDSYDFVLKRLEAEAQFLKERAAEFQAASRARCNAVEAIRERIKSLMVAHDCLELQGQYVRFSVNLSIPSLIVDDEALIPKEFKKTIVTEKIDNASLKKALQDGTPIEGAHLEECYQLRSYAGTKKLGGGK